MKAVEQPDYSHDFCNIGIVTYTFNVNCYNFYPFPVSFLYFSLVHNLV